MSLARPEIKPQVTGSTPKALDDGQRQQEIPQGTLVEDDVSMVSQKARSRGMGLARIDWPQSRK
jgi:hypothetical protein